MNPSAMSHISVVDSQDTDRVLIEPERTKVAGTSLEAPALEHTTKTVKKQMGSPKLDLAPGTNVQSRAWGCLEWVDDNRLESCCRFLARVQNLNSSQRLSTPGTISLAPNPFTAQEHIFGYRSFSQRTTSSAKTPKQQNGLRRFGRRRENQAPEDVKREYGSAVKPVPGAHV